MLRAEAAKLTLKGEAPVEEIEALMNAVADVLSHAGNISDLVIAPLEEYDFYRGSCKAACAARSWAAS
mgnify:CR=1 FL=1